LELRPPGSRAGALRFRRRIVDAHAIQRHRNERKPGMQFQKGQSGNPAGRPRGARNKQTIAAEKLFADDAEVLARVAIDLAKAGDIAALRLCLDRVCAPHRHRPVAFEMPALGVAADAVGAMGTLMEGIAGGELSAPEAAGLAKVIQGFTQALTTADLDKRIAELERRMGK
jgi:hypothetical protein